MDEFDLILTKVAEEVGVMAVVQREQVVLSIGITVQNFQNFRALDNFVSQLVARQTDHAQVHRVSDESVVIHEFVASKCASRLEQKLCRFFEVSNCYAISSLIHFQSISSVPISAFFYQTVIQT